MVSDVTGITATNKFTENIIFEGATADAYETTLTVTDPTADRTVTIPNATGTVQISSLKLETSGDTAAGDNAAIGYTSAEGLILTGQGSTSDITLKNDADATVFTVPTGTDDILFPDNAKAMWGTGSDSEIYHDGSNMYVKNDTGNALLYSDTFQFFSHTSSELFAQFNHNGAVNLYYDNSAKLATTSGGITVTGTVTATAGATLLIKNASGSTLKTIKGMT